jgi:hypothetical protein
VHAETEPALRQFAAETWSDEIPHATNADFDVRVGSPADVILETAARERTDAATRSPTRAFGPCRLPSGAGIVRRFERRSSNAIASWRSVVRPQHSSAKCPTKRWSMRALMRQTSAAKLCSLNESDPSAAARHA